MNCAVSKEMLATYRLQLGPGLTFERGCDLLPYFHNLGISHLYLSPCLKAAAGSAHGYDVVDPSQVDPRLGGQEGFDRLCKASAEFGMGLVLDIVPNHMAAAGRQNLWWWDVLAEGTQSRYAGFFDIRWDHPDPLLHGKVLLPVLGDELKQCLEYQQIQIRRSGQEICLVYFEHEFPVSTRSLPYLLQAVCGTNESPSLAHLAGTFAAGRFQESGASVRGQPADQSAAHPGPGALDDAAKAELDAAIVSINANSLLLKRFLDLQHYRLGYWRLANRDLNYRRFFDIHQLAGVCVEKEAVFAATHELVLRWIGDGRIDGLRIDHPDGLRDPRSYLERLRAAAPRTWIVAEKILEPGETLAPEWPVAGTTGYDFLNLVGGLFVDPRSERLLTDFYQEFTDQSTDYGEIAQEKKLLVLELLFCSELSRLEGLLEDSRRQCPGYGSFRQEDARRALAEVIACFPVYRTYIRPDAGSLGDWNRAMVREALAGALRRRPDIAPDTWRLIEDILLLTHTGKTESEFILRFQQLTGAVMAKGVEDTTFYCFNRLISLNEVGGNPEEFGISPDAFHAFCLRIQSKWPQTLLAGATHDTKRGEDTRLRIDLLSEIPERWIQAVRRWSRMNARFRRKGFPDANTEYFLYQTLAGAWPIGCDRLVPAMLKAAKEAKVHTSWMDPDPVFEEALQAFVLEVTGDPDFTSDLSAFLEPLVWPAVVTSLSQTLIQCTAPGVPDIYQGTELWDCNLADPDNRRAVDFDLRRRLLAEIRTLSITEILNRHAEGLPKLFLLQRVLSARGRCAEAFGAKGAYRPLAADGNRSGHLVAFVRGEKAATLAPRLVVGLDGNWGNTVIDLPAGNWENVFSGEHFSGGTQKLTRLLAHFPVALIVKEE
jgi:(1->4)-alpha-D-glucan 1-alpha-D-glucosylmutase